MDSDANIFSGVPNTKAIHYRYNGQLECILIEDIAYIKSSGVYARICYDSKGHIGEKVICRSIKYLEQILTHYGFIRCHKTYLVNPVKIKYFCRRDRIISVYDYQLPVSVRKSSKVFRILLEMGLRDAKICDMNRK